MDLVVDIGNSLVKFAVFEGELLVEQRCAEPLHKSALEEFVARYPDINRAIVASTRGDAGDVVDMVRSHVGHCLKFTDKTPVPIANDYLTPETLGRDRLAAAVGAATLYPRRNVLIVDFGTAITIDLISSDATFRGGVISPGVNTRFRSLNHYTATLPLCEPTEDVRDLGRTTREAIEQGVMNGVAFEIEGHISRMEKKFDNLCIIFTGGDAKFFVKQIKNTIFANCNLVFCGLHRILEYNASEENHN